MDITFIRLLDSVFEDYPNNPDIISIRESLR